MANWIKGFDKQKTILIANKNQDYNVLNFEHFAPEHNRKNNWKSVNKLTLNDLLGVYKRYSKSKLQST